MTVWPQCTGRRCSDRNASPPRASTSSEPSSRTPSACLLGGAPWKIDIWSVESNGFSLTNLLPKKLSVRFMTLQMGLASPGLPQSRFDILQGLSNKEGLCHFDVDLVFAPPAPTPKAVLDSLLDSIDSNESLGGSALHVDRYSVIAGGVTVERPFKDQNVPGYGVAIIVMCGLVLIGAPFLILAVLRFGLCRASKGEAAGNIERNVDQEDLEVEGAVFLNTRTHVNSQDILRLLYRLANQSVDLTSLNVNGIGADVQIVPLNFRILNRKYETGLLDRTSKYFNALGNEAGSSVYAVLKLYYKTLMQVVIRKFTKGSVILMSDLVFAPPAPTPKAVLDSLLDSIDSNESLGGSALHVDRYSVIAGGVTVERPFKD
ncbi:uncharacterized protein LOC131699099 isoform X3 [Acipenser ruthenus]|nr:uncharacterized protein LOC131699099 isoform X3 [Acipenser ruthenus]